MTIYTDGSCRKNPGPGGFGVVAVEKDKAVHAYSKQYPDTTNNQMELEAILYAMENFGSSGFFVPVVYSDSMYSVNSLNTWIKNWKANGWTRAKGAEIKNLDLIKRYDQMAQDKKIELRYVKGHSTNLWNNIADQLATGKITPEEVMTQYG